MLLGYLDRFGAQAVFGREVSGNEMRRMVLVENVINAYRDSKRHKTMADFIKAQPEQYQILREAEKIWQMQA